MGRLSRASGVLFGTRLSAAAILCLGLAGMLSACGGVTPPPRFSAVSPADAEAPEAPVSPAASLLTGDRPGDQPTPKPPAPAPAPSATPPPLVRGNAQPSASVPGAGIGVRGGYRAEPPKDAPAASPKESAAASEQQAAYSCPMHPKVVAQGPGACPTCGMRLVPADKKAGTRKP
jgi:hypothetical protein